uniref:Sulfatase N-terminal domain-containing protein n=1 Tax=Rhodosorus marinus TaxID=101924 RepID=A0A7S3EJU0_9RHOD|mmetsp:Transcript_41904/g.164240  ORF Transcript_41904/g.164240 Transcript_41904/m.164240 type:complete len:541 (+) Transcript_41904:86-1708(+)
MKGGLGWFVVLCWAVLSGVESAAAGSKPNIIILIGDDLSPREFPPYDTGVWSSTEEETTDHPKYRARTPMLDKMAKEGVFFDRYWSTPICASSRGMMMTGRYATITKWWHNFDYGSWVDENGEIGDIVPLWVTSPLTIGRLAKKAGYGTLWGGRAGMKDVDNLEKFGFKQGVFVPAPQEVPASPLSDFQIVGDGRDKSGKKRLINLDTGKLAPGARAHRSFTWMPHVLLYNAPGEDEEQVYYPNTEKTKEAYTKGTFGPDVDMAVTKKFMRKCTEDGKPFFLYATSRIGHKSFDFLNEKADTWAPTPKIKWNSRKKKYVKSKPVVKGKPGNYTTSGINKGGIRRHVEYLDYTLWQLVQKCKKLGVLDNTVILFATDNGTKGYGKAVEIMQRGPHVPLFVYAPGLNMTKRGRSHEFASSVDLLPTLADLMGVSHLLDGYKLHGQSLYPYLFGNAKKHTRDYNYSYQTRPMGHFQLIRGSMVMRDSAERWYDVREENREMDNYPNIWKWEKVPKELQDERDRLNRILERFDLHDTEHDYVPS